MNVAQASLKLFAASVGTAVVGFAGLTFFARELGPAQFGIFVLFQAAVSMAAFLVDFGVRTSVEKRISERQNAADILATALVMKLVLFIIAISAIVLFRQRLNNYVGTDVSVLLAITIVASDLGGLVKSALRGELRVEATAILNFSNQFVWVCAGTVLVFAGLRAHALIYAFLAGEIVRLTWGAYRCSTQVGRPSIEQARSLFDFARYDFISGLGVQAFSWIDVLCIGWLLTQEAVGIYEVAWRVAQVTLLLSSAVAKTVLPQVSAWDAENAVSRIEALITNSMTPSLFFVIPSVFGVGLLSSEILGLVFGQDYATGGFVLMVITISGLFTAVQSIVGRCLLGLDRPDLVARATTVAVSLNAILNVALIWQFGIVGAAIATTLAYAAGTTMRVLYLSRSLEVRFPHREIGWCTGAAVIMAGAVRWLQELLLVDTILELLFVVAVGAVVYGAVVLASEQLRRRILVNMRSILS